MEGAERRRGFPLPARRVRVGRRVFLDVSIPGWPSPALDRFLEGELERIAPTRPGAPPLHLALLAVTRLCPLRCMHCSDADVLASEESLSTSQLLDVARGVAALGASHLELTGGEPMARLDAVEAICRELAPGVDVWVLTSGVGLDSRAATRLRDAGATGVTVSIDHWEADRHDAFRGRAGVFLEAVEGVRAARDAGLVVALSVTLTPEVATPAGLEHLGRLGRELRVPFLRLLEPRAVGAWAGRDVALPASALDVVVRFARASHAADSPLPLVELPALTQRSLGCFGGGDRYLFVDAKGDVHACPFCRRSAGSALDGGLEAARDVLLSQGCKAYPRAHPDPVGIGPHIARRARSS
jgi:MoaA/NifB/PqqE/SkfB family radical SAM enzyme